MGISSLLFFFQENHNRRSYFQVGTITPHFNDLQRQPHLQGLPPTVGLASIPPPHSSKVSAPSTSHLTENSRPWNHPGEWPERWLITLQQISKFVLSSVFLTLVALSLTPEREEKKYERSRT